MERLAYNKKLARRLTALFALVIIGGNGANLAKHASVRPSDPLVSKRFADKPSVLTREELTFTLSRPLGPNEGRIAIIIASTDVSSLLTHRDNSLVYSPTIIQLPIGESSVIVYIVDSSQRWRPIASFSL